ncbi:hypothetical protein [Leifsonia sp. Leaf264]|uniref:hypothetical protein n=1 Tax=Leifsonia sp. Leaf264 TaxID=1736314 RepID=UPI000701662E|nr:hypothetical protein [Leifsonia sp. Leaf264]KQO98533.1 hypothetical protein ASF30_10755 [Leifsonia sp. Leaf264]
MEYLEPATHWFAAWRDAQGWPHIDVPDDLDGRTWFKRVARAHPDVDVEFWLAKFDLWVLRQSFQPIGLKQVRFPLSIKFDSAVEDDDDGFGGFKTEEGEAADSVIESILTGEGRFIRFRVRKANYGRYTDEPVWKLWSELPRDESLWTEDIGGEWTWFDERKAFEVAHEAVGDDRPTFPFIGRPERTWPDLLTQHELNPDVRTNM